MTASAFFSFDGDGRILVATEDGVTTGDPPPPIEATRIAGLPDATCEVSGLWDGEARGGGRDG